MDEALLDVCDAGQGPEVLRFWEPAQHFVVTGYANEVRREINLELCRERGIPILRRCTGGGTVLQGPGCLNYALVLRFDGRAELQSIHGTNEYVMRRHAAAFTSLLGRPVVQEGHTDLAANGLKFSGNAQRRRRKALLFHGSILLALDLDLLESVLPLPSKAPAYRLNRSHRDFLMNLGLSASAVKQTLSKAWGASEPLGEVPLPRVAALVHEKYSSPEWNFKF